MPVTQDDFPDIPKVTPISPPFTANALTPYGKVEAAIALKVPQSGIPELDAMIRESRRLDMATAAMRGTTTPELCLLKADALLAASEKEERKC